MSSATWSSRRLRGVSGRWIYCRAWHMASGYNPCSLQVPTWWCCWGWPVDYWGCWRIWPRRYSCSTLLLLCLWRYLGWTHTWLLWLRTTGSSWQWSTIRRNWNQSRCIGLTRAILDYFLATSTGWWTWVPGGRRYWWLRRTGTSWLGLLPGWWSWTSLGWSSYRSSSWASILFCLSSLVHFWTAWLGTCIWAFLIKYYN